MKKKKKKPAERKKRGKNISGRIWEEMEKLFVTSKITYSRLARKYNVSIKTIYNRSYQDQWREKREIFHYREAKLREENKIEKKERQKELRKNINKDSQIIKAKEDVYNTINSNKINKQVITNSLKLYENVVSSESELQITAYLLNEIKMTLQEEATKRLRVNHPDKYAVLLHRLALTKSLLFESRQRLVEIKGNDILEIRLSGENE